MLLRDVIERHRVTNVEALRRLQRHLLANPAGSFSVSKFHRDLKSQGLPVAEETLHLLLHHLEDAFMVRVVGMHTASERQRMRNPRKVYPVDPGLIPVFQRAGIDAALRTYLTVGGFPEAQAIDIRDRLPLLKGYVDLMLLRDVIERHRVTNVEALRRLQRHLLATPAGPFSVSKFHRDLRSQGLPVAEETLHLLLHHLDDAFMVRVVGMHTASERQRMRNPRKAYPVDPGLIPVFQRAGRENRGRSLETAVLIELERRGYAAGWVRVDDDLEVDFFAEHHVADDLLVQVSLATEADATWERELRSLQVAAEVYPHARPLLLTLDPTPPARPLPTRLEWMPASRWLLGEG